MSNAETPKDVVQVMIDWARDPNDTPFAVLLGEYGMGKTWNSELLAFRLVELIEKKEPNVPTPIFLDLRRAVDEKSKLLSGDPPQLEDLLESLSRNNTPSSETPLTAAEIFSAVREEGALLILDGLDEVLAHKRDDAWGQTFIRRLFDVLPFSYWPNHLNPKTKSAYPGKLLLTCRTHYFKSVQTQNAQILGLTREQHEAAKPRAWQLLPFSREQVLQYLVNLEIPKPGQSPAEVYDLIAAVHNLSEISGRPQGLKMVCEQIGEIEAARRDGKTVNGAAIYEWMVNKWLDRDHGKHQLTEEVKRELMQDLALHMWRLGVREIPWGDLSKWFSQKLQLGILNQNAEPFLTDLRNATFLVRPGDDEFAFAHTSILEYFLSTRIYRSLEEDDVEIWEDLNPSREVLDFVLQHHQTRPSYSQKKARATLARHLGQATAGDAARKSLLDVFLLAPEEWLLKTLDISGLSLEGYAFSNLTLDALTADDAVLGETQWTRCNFRRSSWRNADCRQMLWERLTGDYADFSKANLFAGRWRNVDIAQQVFDEALHIDTLQKSPAAPVQPQSNLSSRDLRLLWGAHSGILNACSMNAAGDRFITAGNDGTARVWNDKGECIHVLKGHVGEVLACSMSAAGDRFITAGKDGDARLWNDKGECIHVLKRHRTQINARSMSASGNLFIIVEKNGNAHVWNYKNECVHVLENNYGWIRVCSMNASGDRFIVVGYDGRAYVLNKRGDCINEIKAWFSSHVLACSMSAAGDRFITAEDGGTARVWNDKGECIHVLKGHDCPINACSMNAAGDRFMTVGDDGTARVWNDKGECIYVLKGHDCSINTCSMSVAGDCFITVGDDGTARVWNDKGECIHVLKGHTGRVRACSMNAAGDRLIMAEDGGTARVWKDKGECIHVLKGQIGPIIACSMSAAGDRFMTAGYYGSARVWNDKGECIHVLKGHDGSVTACSMSAAGDRFMTAGYDGSARVWDDKGECIHVLEGYTGAVLNCSMNAAGDRFITAGYDGVVCVWNDKGKRIYVHKGHMGLVRACSMSAAGDRFITAGADGTGRVWNDKGECIHVLEGHVSEVRACSISAAGDRFITAGDDGTARVWNDKGKCIRVLKGYSGSLYACSISASGDRIITASQDAVHFWNYVGETWQCALELRPQSRTIIWLDAGTRTLKIKGPGWPYWQLTHPDDNVRNALGETIAEFGPLAHEHLANAEEWRFMARDDIPPD